MMCCNSGKFHGTHTVRVALAEILEQTDRLTDVLPTNDQ